MHEEATHAYSVQLNTWPEKSDYKYEPVCERMIAHSTSIRPRLPSA